MKWLRGATGPVRIRSASAFFPAWTRDQWSTIIGVVGDVKHIGLDAGTDPEMYYHYLQIPPEAMNLAEGDAWRSRFEPAPIRPG